MDDLSENTWVVFRYEISALFLMISLFIILSWLRLCLLLLQALNKQHCLEDLPSRNLAQLLVTEYKDKQGNPLVLHNIGIERYIEEPL